MFNRELVSKFEAIFGVPVTFNAPGESYEQDKLFIEITDVITRAGQGRVNSKITGSLAMFAQMEKLTYGFFSKKVSLAANDLTKNLFLFDVDREALNSPARLINISERRTSFVYLYSAQYDPNHGSLTGIKFSEGA